jgi:hypothetical protein
VALPAADDCCNRGWSALQLMHDTWPSASPSRVLLGSSSLPRCSARCHLSEKPSKRVSPSSGGQLQCAATCKHLLLSC